MSSVVSPSALFEFARQVLIATGVPPVDADLVADSLVTAELWGYPSHGMLRLPWYVARLRNRVMNSVTNGQILVDRGALLLIDGCDGVGQVLMAQATQLGIERARLHGASVVGIRNSNHFGTAAYFTRRAAEAGFVALLSSNASPAMAPWGGRRKSIGTNPWSIAAPAGAHGIAVMDIANSAAARGKIYIAAERHEAIPDTWATDETGLPTTDAEKALHGLLLPMGGHKGYVIAFMMDVLSGVLTGSRFGLAVSGPYNFDETSGCGHMLITIDIASLATRKNFDDRMEHLIHEIKSNPTVHGVEEIFFPGEVENKNAERKMLEGILISEQTWHSLGRLAQETGISVPMTQPAR